MREDLVPNLLRNPRALLYVGGLALSGSSRRELAELRERELPVLVVSGSDDSVIPVSAFEALCGALEPRGRCFAATTCGCSPIPMPSTK